MKNSIYVVMDVAGTKEVYYCKTVVELQVKGAFHSLLVLKTAKHNMKLECNL